MPSVRFRPLQRPATCAYTTVCPPTPFWISQSGAGGRALLAVEPLGLTLFFRRDPGAGARQVAFLNSFQEAQ